MEQLQEGQLIVFELLGQRYAIPVLKTQEIIRMTEITPVPQTSKYVAGIINLRGSIVPVIDLNKRMGLPMSESNKDSRIIVVEHQGQSIGMIVDRVQEVAHFTPDEVEDTSGTVDGNAFVGGIVKKKDALWLLLDVEKVVG
ncbi:MAG: chemotaxis protein CheW [Bacillota bacterium]|uniref:chemotaxis protein CheW n=1 Tax=Desulforudis sp. DRI-14 TaxID=3459793 RepID=UPI00347C9E2D